MEPIMDMQQQQATQAGRARLRTERQVARILEALKGRQMTARELADHLHMSYQNTKFYIRLLRDEPRRVRVCSYVRSGGRSAQVYALGVEPDAKYARKGKPRNPRPDTRELVLKTLAQPHSMQMLMARLKMTDRWLSHHVRSLREAGQVHISRWTRSCASLVPHYQAGAAPDAPRLQPKTRSDYTAQAKRKKTAWVAALGIAANSDLARAA